MQAFYRVKRDVGRLRICYPENDRHTGFYTCLATNSRGKSNATAFLDVLGKIALNLNYFSILYFRKFWKCLPGCLLVCGLPARVSGCQYVFVSLFVCLT